MSIIREEHCTCPGGFEAAETIGHVSSSCPHFGDTAMTQIAALRDRILQYSRDASVLSKPGDRLDSMATDFAKVVGLLLELERARQALAALEAPAVEGDKDEDETYEIGVGDGYQMAVQEIDMETGGDGEYRYCTDHDPERHCPDAATMKARIVERFAARQPTSSAVEVANVLLREIHEAMAVVMQFRRSSTTQEQRDQAHAAIQVWRKVQAHLAEATARQALAATRESAAVERERERWQWLSERPALELSYYSPVYGDDDDQSCEWRVSEVGGSINDREWVVIGRGDTPLDAVDDARAAIRAGGA